MEAHAIQAEVSVNFAQFMKKEIAAAAYPSIFTRAD
jgi:hypothetical protein